MVEWQELDTLEEAVRSITAEFEQTAQTEPSALPVVGEEAAVEEGEIGELERVRRYYWKAVKVAATYAAALEQYVPVLLRPLSNYTLQELKTKRANCRTAMLSSDDAIAASFIMNKQEVGMVLAFPFPQQTCPIFTIK